MKILEKYNQYIKGSLTDTELEAFTSSIVTDHFEKEKLKSQWSKILQEEHGLSEATQSTPKVLPQKRSKRFFKIGLSFAASLLLLLLSWFTYQTLSVPAYEKLLSEELNKPYVESISRKGSIEELRLQAVAAYNSRAYSAAAAYFQQLIEKDQTIDWTFYLGLCQLYQKQSNLAIQSFTTVLDHPNQNYSIETNWYLGLAYLMNDDFDSAIPHLQLVADRSDDEMAWKVREAKELLEVIEELE